MPQQTEVTTGCRVRWYKKGGDPVVKICEIVSHEEMDLEADPPRIAPHCYVARALLGREVGDTVRVIVPGRGSFEAIILEVEPLPD